MERLHALPDGVLALAAQELLAAELVRTLLALRSKPTAKVIVYVGAARLVSFFSALCRRMGLGAHRRYY